ncbi:STAS domain-containing protein [Streptomyces nigra]|uniref:STAS domain-containing protein n=1 Tax=Streptomyces nigra TaxID=1827580 RepID=UPI00368E3759
MSSSGLSLSFRMRFFRLRRSGWTRVRSVSDHRVVGPRGTLGARNAEAAGRRLVRLIKAGPGVQEVDLAGVEYLSPDGCETLFTALHAARAHGAKLIVTHANARARSVMHQIGFSRALPAQTTNHR